MDRPVKSGDAKGCVSGSIFNSRSVQRVIASEAKQSISPRKGRLDCFVASLLAITSQSRATPRSRSAERPSCASMIRLE
jgi:hypothetical protein